MGISRHLEEEAAGGASFLLFITGELFSLSREEANPYLAAMQRAVTPDDSRLSSRR